MRGVSGDWCGDWRVVTALAVLRSREIGCNVSYCRHKHALYTACCRRHKHPVFLICVFDGCREALLCMNIRNVLEKLAFEDATALLDQ